MKLNDKQVLKTLKLMRQAYKANSRAITKHGLCYAWVGIRNESIFFLNTIDQIKPFLRTMAEMVGQNPKKNLFWWQRGLIEPRLATIDFAIKFLQLIKPNL